MSAAPNIADDAPLVTYTIFPDTSPVTKTERSDVEWSDLVDRIRNAPTYKQKGDCPLISMCEYGDLLSDGGILRHAANVQRAYGCELDYDGGIITPAKAAEMLQVANIKSVIYTSPSHRPDAPRFRVLLPFSEPAIPEKRAEYVARANRVFGGKIARESFALSQTFYIGRIQGADYEVLETHGRCIDMAMDLAPLYHHGNGKVDTPARDETTDADLRAAFGRGKDRYNAMLKLSSRWASRGMGADDIESSLLELLGTGTINGDGIDLRSRCRPLAETAVKKYGETRGPGREPDKEPPPPLFDSFRAPIGMQTFTEAQSLPEMIVEGLLPTDIGMAAGAGGASKTSLKVWEGVHIILGKQLYGRDVLRPGNILAISAEDSTRRYRYRLRQICDCIPNLTQADKQHIAQSFMVEDLVGKGVRLVQVDMDGNLMQTGAVDRLIDAYINANISLVTVDPYVFFGPGERFVNDAESAMAQAAHRISTNLNCAVQYIHHTGKANFREGRTDQYSGRGGSALPDGMRYVHVLARHEKSHEAMPSQFTPDDIVNGRVLSLHVPKITDAPPISDPIWIRRSGWRFDHVIARNDGQQDMQRDRLRTVWAFVDAQAVLGIRHTGRSLEDASKEIGIGRNEIRTAVHVALELKHLIEVKLPKAEQQGRRQTYLAKGLEP